MRIIILSLFILLSVELRAQTSETGEIDWCLQEGAKQMRALLEADREGILLKQFELTTLKLALVTRAPGNKTLEEYVRSRAKELKDGALIGELERIYTTYGESEIIQAALDSLELANYWKSSLRLDNQDAALFTEIHRMSSESSPFNRSDSAILWLFNKISDTQGGAGSAKYNETLSSNHIAKLLGAVGVDRQVSYGLLALQVEKVEGELEAKFSSLRNSLSAQWKLRCDRVADLSCLADQVYQNSILQLHSAPDWLATIKKTIFKQNHNGELIFDFPSHNLQSIELLDVDHHPDLAFRGLADLLIYDHHYLKYRDVSRYQKELNELENAQTIIEFHKDSKDQRDYAIVDKAKGVLYLVAASGQLRETRPLSGSALGDVFEGGGAGVYHLEATGKQLMVLSDERARGRSIKLQAQAPKKTLEEGSLVYILPTDQSNIFKVKNGELNFTTTQRKSSYAPYNYSAKSTTPRATAFYINDSTRRNKTSLRFVNSLAINKARLMKLYNLSNDEYNELAKLAYGILGNESDYGRSVKYLVKEALPLVVALFKGNGIDTSKNSRGLTQMKRVPVLIEKEYGIKKDELGDPEKSAVATMGFLADALIELKAKARNNPDINSDNQYDYLHYIYTGRSSEITGGTATPEKNIYYRQIREAGEGLFVLERKDS